MWVVRVGGRQRAQQPVVDLGVEERDALPVTGVLEQPPFVQPLQFSHLSQPAEPPAAVAVICARRSSPS